MTPDDAKQTIETMPADTRLTDAQMLLPVAQELVADYVDGVPRRSVRWNDD